MPRMRTLGGGSARRPCPSLCPATWVPQRQRSTAILSVDGIARAGSRCLPCSSVEHLTTIIDDAIQEEAVQQVPVERCRRRDAILAEPDQDNRTDKPASIGTVGIWAPGLRRQPFLDLSNHPVARRCGRGRHVGDPRPPPEERPTSWSRSHQESIRPESQTIRARRASSNPAASSGTSFHTVLASTCGTSECSWVSRLVVAAGPPDRRRCLSLLAGCRSLGRRRCSRGTLSTSVTRIGGYVEPVGVLQDVRSAGAQAQVQVVRLSSRLRRCVTASTG